MKQGNIYTNLVMLLLALGLACYFGFYLYNSLHNPFSTTYAYTYTVHDSVEVEGLVVRDEEVFASQDGITQAIRQTGEKVGRGQTVAYVYRDSTTQADQAALTALEQEAEILQAVLSEDGDLLSAAHQDEMILQAVVNLRATTANQDFGDLDSQLVDLKSGVIQRAYAYGGEVSTQELTTRLASVNAQISALSSSTASTTTAVTASQSGVYCPVVDGLEDVLSSDNIYSLTPQEVEGYLSQELTQNGEQVGKLIVDDRWYLLAVVPEEEGTYISGLSSITVEFSGEYARTLSMSVYAVGDAVDGQCVVVLSTDRYLSEVTLLRQQSVALIYRSYEGLRIPKAALRMQTSTYTDKETGEETTTQTLGVYTVVSGRAEFHPVTILSEQSDYYVVSAVETGASTFRAGDEVVVYAVGLYDGKPLS